VILLVAANAAWSPRRSSFTSAGNTCGQVKSVYKNSSCCSSAGGNSTTSTQFQVIPAPSVGLNLGTNWCADQKPHNSGDNQLNGSSTSDGYFNNINCTALNGVVQALEQAGANVTLGYEGQIDSSTRTPISTSYFEAGLCPVNVHWHLGAEHFSVGDYDETENGPADVQVRHSADVRLGNRCKQYDSNDAKFTTAYDWNHCSDMTVGETYEIHWPHSKAGACGTPHQYQTPFYDGVFCREDIITLDPLNTFETIGVQAQVFTIVNDENYYYPNLFGGMIVDEDFGDNVAIYTGSSTGTSRDDTICSQYTPITWQVDRKCHLISASSFDKMCADMKQNRDDMSSDLHPHGARETVMDSIAGNNMVTGDMSNLQQQTGNGN